MSPDQLPMDFATPKQENNHRRGEDYGPVWLGLSLDHRSLFDALQDDWLRPPDEERGHVLGVRAFADEGERSPNGHRIWVRIKFDPERLPRMAVHIRSGENWGTSSVSSLAPNDLAVFWPGPLPTFAISELLVASDEERSRLTGLARQVSNVPLPVPPRVFRPGEDANIPNITPPSETLPGICLPPEIDAARGAMSMAMWAVPRIGPWLDLLCESFGSVRSDKMASLTEYLRLPWWVSPPWVLPSDPRSNAPLQERLWLSAMRSFRDARKGGAGLMATDLVDHVFDEARRDASDVGVRQLREWTQETIKVLRGDAKLDLTDWKASPVGKAIQLVLVRPDPYAFRKWKDDIPSLPPGVWWSAAALCGLLHGYRRLPTFFRGELEQQRLFAILSLFTLGTAPAAENWAAIVQRNPEWHRQAGDIVFSWSQVQFSRKPENARGRWYDINLDDVAARKTAEEISRSNGWDCIRTKVTIPAGDILFFGGSLEVVSAPPSRITMKGPTKFTLPLTAMVESELDVEEFRKCIVTEGANILPPETPLRIASSATEEIPGLNYMPDFLTGAQEAELVAVIDKGEWSSVLKRRVQHFGWRYDYKTREIDLSMRLGPLPEWAMVLAKRLKAEGLLPHLADQVIVNEYIGKQGISKHTDLFPCFDDGVAMISLLESWEMIFREVRKGGRPSVAKVLENRSVAIMTGDVRYKWTHEIPARATEPGGLRRHRRVSVTFRKVNEAAVVREPRRSRKR
jgi:alkylated DNA repair dioxygenase AlkB